MRFAPFFLALALTSAPSSIPALGKAIPAEPDLPFARISGDTALRKELMGSWFTDKTAAVLKQRPRHLTLPGGEAVLLRAEKRGTELDIILARERAGVPTDWAQGSWRLTRALSDGSPTSFSFFPRSDESLWIEITPDLRDRQSPRASLTLHAAGACLRKGFPLAITFERALISTFEEIVALAGPSFPREYLDLDTGRYAETRALTAAIREALPSVAFLEDGAIDSDGRSVFISTGKRQGGTLPGLNCSGSVKWIVDGILRPETGERLSIRELIVPVENRGSSFTEPFEAVREPYFGLDWVRNLARLAGLKLQGSNSAELSAWEVTSSPFALLEGKGGEIQNYPGFLRDSGYQVEGLRSLLYCLAREEPGYLYLFSVNRDMGTEVKLRQHYHVGAFLPQFDAEGRFSAPVFESAAETDLDLFIKRHRGELVYLARVPARERFEP